MCAGRSAPGSTPSWSPTRRPRPRQPDPDRRSPRAPDRRTTAGRVHCFNEDVADDVSETKAKRSRGRMRSAERREQLISISRGLFAERGYDGTSIEEIASRAEVSKPVVYEHFGGKEGLYAVVVDREVRSLLSMMQAALTAGQPRMLLEQAAMALLD